MNLSFVNQLISKFIVELINSRSRHFFSTTSILWMIERSTSLFHVNWEEKKRKKLCIFSKKTISTDLVVRRVVLESKFESFPSNVSLFLSDRFWLKTKENLFENQIDEDLIFNNELEWETTNLSAEFLTDLDFYLPKYKREFDRSKFQWEIVRFCFSTRSFYFD